MRCSRSFAALAAGMLLVLCSGCGGEGKKEPTGDPNDLVDLHGLSAAGKGPIDLSLVTPNDFVAIVIHPRRITQSPLVAAQLKDELVAGAIKQFGIDPSEVAQIVILVSMDHKPPGPAEPVTVMITRFTHEVDAKEVLGKLLAAEAATRAEAIQEVKVGGKTCFDLGALADSMAYAPDKSTIILTSKENMARVVSAAEPKGPLYERLKKAEAENDLIVALEPGAFPDLDKAIAATKKGGSPLDLEPVKKLRGGTATLNLTAPSMLRAVLDAQDAEAAGNVEEMLQQVLRMASGGLLVVKQGMPKDAQATFGPLVKLANEFVDGAKTTKSGSQVVLDIKRPEVLDTAGASIAAAVRQYVMEARAAARRVQQMNNLRQISLALLLYEQSQRSFPPAAISKDGKPLLSWRVAILPYVGATSLCERFHLDEPWDSPHNLDVAKTMPSIFQSPDSPSDGKTRVMLFTGKGAAFDGEKKIRMLDIRDGAAATILCVEAGADKAVPWTKPEDLPFDPANPSAALGNVSPQGLLAAFFDGHIMQLKVDNQTLKALITPDGGEPIDQAKLYGGR